MSSLALFDFDGTLTQKDSLFEFIKFAFGREKFYKGMLFLSPILVAYKLGFVKNDDAKLQVLNYFFKDKQNLWREKTSLFHAVIPSLLKQKAYQKFQWHKSQNHKIIIVSASPNAWLEKWCQSQNIELIATILEYKNSKLTYKTPNCHGREKVTRINSYLDIKDYKNIYAYGDTSSDKYMLSIATHKFFKTF